MGNGEHVISWRRRTKKRMVEAMGGKCQGCGYDKVPAAFDFHHIDPTTKKYLLSGASANPKSWIKLVIELRKCLILCATCHRELHAGERDVPHLISPFNESYVDYRQMKLDGNKKLCPACKELKNFSGKTCSQKCEANHRKVDWEKYNPIKLREEGFSNVAIAEMVGCSGVAVGKRIKKMLS